MITYCNPGAGAELIRSGKLVAFPTETVYGLGADALNELAVKRVFRAKGRPPENPMICHLHDLEQVFQYSEKTDLALRLARMYWPGPMTLLLPHQGRIPSIVTAGSPLAGFRIPNHPLTLELLRLFGGPVVGPSANPSGKRSPTNARMVEEGLGDKIDGILDGGDCSIGVESTVLLPDENGIRIFRHGGLSLETLLQDGFPLAEDSAGPQNTDPFLHAPGQLSSHYEPDVPLIVLMDTPPPARQPDIRYSISGDILSSRNEVSPIQPIHIATRNDPSPFTGGTMMELSQTGNALEAAKNLFQVFASISHLSPRPDLITIRLMAEAGIGRAVNDRILRAARFFGYLKQNELDLFLK